MSAAGVIGVGSPIVDIPALVEDACLTGVFVDYFQHYAREIQAQPQTQGKRS